MNTRHVSRWLWPALAVVFLTTVSCVSAVAQPPVVAADVKTAGGLTVVTFKLDPGTIWVNLPDDIRPGDTISGTLRGEPKGTTEAERATNLAEMRKFRVELSNRLGAQPEGVRWGDYAGVQVDVPKDQPPTKTLSVGLTRDSGLTLTRITLPVSNLPPGSIFGPDPATVAAASNARWGDYSSDPNSDFRIPRIGQQGRPITLYGPFDGNASNTSLRFGPVGSTTRDFEKNTENVSGGFGLIRPLAESPRKGIFEWNTSTTGPVELLLNEGGKTAIASHRNVGVQLSAPKTNLMRGEKTVVTIEVSGLAGIIKDVPLQLDSKGVITMEGGSFQNLRIKPEEVSLDGRYKTNRTITGVQAGGFNVTATVIVGPFDVCLQDDNDRTRALFWNTFTGDYLFTCGGAECPPAGGTKTGGTQTGGTQTGATQTGGTQTGTGTTVVPPVGGTTFTGTGKPAMKGCIITLSHNAPDRRVFARLDACTKTGDAALETKSPKTNFNITDKNTADNAVASPPPPK